MNLRLTYERLKASNQDARITQGSLVSEVLLTGSQQNLQFNLKENQPNAGSNNLTPNEQRLKLSDAFCITNVSIQIRRVTQAGATATATEINQGLLYTFANPNVFTGSGEAAALRSIANGILTVTVNKQQIYTQFPARGFTKIGTSQQGTTTAAIAGPTTYTIARDERNGLIDGFVPLWPTINLQGAWDMIFQLNLGIAQSMGATGNFSNYATLLLDGFLLQNAAKYIFPE